MLHYQSKTQEKDLYLVEKPIDDETSKDDSPDCRISDEKLEVEPFQTESSYRGPIRGHRAGTTVDFKGPYVVSQSSSPFGIP